MGPIGINSPALQLYVEPPGIPDVTRFLSLRNAKNFTHLLVCGVAFELGARDGERDSTNAAAAGIDGASILK